MKRTYLEEDMELIQKYFPGAKTVTLRTPFDLTRRTTQHLPHIAPGDLHSISNPHEGWMREILWTN